MITEPNLLSSWGYVSRPPHQGFTTRYWNPYWKSSPYAPEYNYDKANIH